MRLSLLLTKGIPTISPNPTGPSTGERDLGIAVILSLLHSTVKLPSQMLSAGREVLQESRLRVVLFYLMGVTLTSEEILFGCPGPCEQAYTSVFLKTRLFCCYS